MTAHPIHPCHPRPSKRTLVRLRVPGTHWDAGVNGEMGPRDAAQRCRAQPYPRMTFLCGLDMALTRPPTHCCHPRPSKRTAVRLRVPGSHWDAGVNGEMGPRDAASGEGPVALPEDDSGGKLSIFASFKLHKSAGMRAFFYPLVILRGRQRSVAHLRPGAVS